MCTFINVHSLYPCDDISRVSLFYAIHLNGGVAHCGISLIHNFILISNHNLFLARLNGH